MPAMRLLPLLLSLLLAACVGTDVGNPDLEAEPGRLALAATCAGGTARASVLVRNAEVWDLEAVVRGGAGLEAYPSVFSLGPSQNLELVAVIHLPREAEKKARGKIVVEHRRIDSGEEVDPLEIPWSAPVAPDAPRATSLCGEPIDCAFVDFGPVFVGATWQRPLEVVNDGCAPLVVEGIEVEGDARVEGPALPTTLAPGERWSGALLIDPTAPGTSTGQVAISTDDPQRQVLTVGWTASVQGG